MSRWDAARAASRRPLRKYKPCGPVGEKQDCIADHMRDRARGRVATSLWLDPQEVSACAGCGYHLCSCGQVSGCHRSMVMDREYHTRDCGERPCALAKAGA